MGSPPTTEVQMDQSSLEDHLNCQKSEPSNRPIEYPDLGTTHRDPFKGCFAMSTFRQRNENVLAGIHTFALPKGKTLGKGENKIIKMVHMASVVAEGKVFRGTVSLERDAHKTPKKVHDKPQPPRYARKDGSSSTHSPLKRAREWRGGTGSMSDFFCSTQMRGASVVIGP